jgi:hypothetical protein
MNHGNQDCQRQRIAHWGESYLKSTTESYRRAKRFSHKGDYFTSLPVLFACFNNLYCLLSRFDREEKESCKIQAAVGELPAEQIESLYTDEYFRLVCQLNDRIPEQFTSGPDASSTLHGVVNMGKYFSGKEPDVCVAHVRGVAPVYATTDKKRTTLQKLAASILYTVRNNQFHVVKGPHNLADEEVLKAAYTLLEPLVKALLHVAWREVGDVEGGMGVGMGVKEESP